MKSWVIVPRIFYNRDTVVVAQDLIGKQLVVYHNNQYLTGIISETESYRSDDPASHSYRGLTNRNHVMFGPVGHAYVYMSYGIHYCLNVSARDTDKHQAGGVLIRSIIPIKGLDIMMQNRKNKPIKILTNGPGKLTEALGITREYNGVDMTQSDSPLYITYGYDIDKRYIKVTPRIGISVARDYPWRFIIKSSKVQELVKLKPKLLST